MACHTLCMRRRRLATKQLVFKPYTTYVKSTIVSKAAINHRIGAAINHRVRAATNHRAGAAINHRVEAAINHRVEAATNHRLQAGSSRIHTLRTEFSTIRQSNNKPISYVQEYIYININIRHKNRSGDTKPSAIFLANASVDGTVPLTGIR